MGESPLFSPEHETAAEAKEAILLVIRRDPHLLGYRRSRWRLEMVAQACDWLRVTTAAGLSRLLKRLGIRLKCGRAYVHSPDRHYLEKLSLIQLARMRAYYEPERYAFVYVDEFTYHRQPTVAQGYEAAGPYQPLARRSHRSNTWFRVIGALNAFTGRVTYQQRSRISRLAVADFWTQLRADYPDAELIYAAIDNWPVHFHVDALACLQPQLFPWPPYVPAHWPTEPSARAKAKPGNLPIKLLPLPTYASWLNPIEKLWRWLKQDVLHLHSYSDDWQALKQEVAWFLDQFRNGSDELLRYVGLLGI